MCGVGGYQRLGFSFKTSQASRTGCVLCLPFEGPLWLLRLPCFFGFSLSIIESCVFTLDSAGPAQSGDYSWAADRSVGRGVGGALNECQYILMKPIGRALFVFNSLKSPGAWLRPQNRQRLVWSTRHTVWWLNLTRRMQGATAHHTNHKNNPPGSSHSHYFIRQQTCLTTWKLCKPLKTLKRNWRTEIHEYV